MQIRKAKPADAVKLEHLVNGAYRGESGKRGWTTEAHLLSGLRVDEDRLLAAMAKPQDALLVAEDANGAIEACVQLTLKEGGIVFLSMLTVNVDRQTGGLGKRLLGEAERYAKREMQASRIEMFVIAIRSELVSWYERRGYRATGLRHEFPKDEKWGVPLQAGLDFISLYKEL
jgi:N-acetylglutamate synthase-like GNAT family acetyltransferase